MTPVDIATNFTFDGTDLLYANIKRVPVEELRMLLARGSGYVVKCGQRRKVWFQAQCAHYGLPTQGTLAAVRHQLDKFLAHSTARVPEQLASLEEKMRREYTGNSTATTPAPPSDVLEMKDQLCNPQQEETPLELPNTRDHPTEPCAVASPAPQAQPRDPFADKTNHKPVPTMANPTKKHTIPRAKLAAVLQFNKSSSALHALRRIKHMVGPRVPTSETETESDDDSDSSFQSDVHGRAAAWRSYQIRPPPPRSLVPFTQDVVSGRWELSVTAHTMLPLLAPWRPASSKWLQGDMNVCLSGDGRSLAAEFALLGMDGVFKSRKCELRTDGICSWVQFVAQMPITTAKPSQERGGGRIHNLVFGPSETQYGYLRFHGGGKVGGMLRCRDYGRIEFTGVRVGGPLDMASNWRNFVE